MTIPRIIEIRPKVVCLDLSKSLKIVEILQDSDFFEKHRSFSENLVLFFKNSEKMKI